VANDSVFSQGCQGNVTCANLAVFDADFEAIQVMSRCHANYLLLLVLFGGLFVSASLAKTPYTDEVSPREDRDTVTNGDGSAARMIQHPRYKWTRSDHTIALLNHDRVVWQFNYGRSASKPNFHPLALLDGTDLRVCA
jgi:hypothetical protein